VQVQAGAALTVKVAAATTMKAMSNDFIGFSPLKFRSSFLPSTRTEADAG